MQVRPVMYAVVGTFLYALALGLPILLAPDAWATDHNHDSSARHDEQAHHDHGAHDAHMHMLAERSYVRSVQAYSVPDLSLIGMDGGKVSLTRELSSEGPIMLNFIYSTCTTICPVMTMTFAQVQRQLGPENGNVRMISITIDPEHDGPSKLREYAMKFMAGSTWRFLTGSRADIIDTQKAFDVYRGDKANHIPVTFMRAAADGPWIRLEGLMSATDLVREYHQLTAQ